MTRLALLFSVTFAVGLALSSCGGDTSCSAKNCAGCCDAVGSCHDGDKNAYCGTAGAACAECDGITQACLGKVCAACFGPTCVDPSADAGVADAGCAPTAVLCSDQAISNLTLYAPAAPAGATITNTAAGGEFVSDVVATAGGSSPSQSYVYARFTESGLEKVAIGDLASLDSMDWDIAFRRFVVRLNGGDSGPSCVGAQLMSSVAFEQVTAAPPSAVYATDDFLDDANACTFVDDQSGLTTTPATALSPVSPSQSYYAYGSCVAMTGQVAVIRLRSGRTLKLKVNKYYQTAAQQLACDTNGTMGTGGYVQVRWAYLP